MKTTFLSLTIISMSCALVCAMGLTLVLFVFFTIDASTPETTKTITLEHISVLSKSLLVAVSVATPSAIVSNMKSYFEEE